MSTPDARTHPDSTRPTVGREDILERDRLLRFWLDRLRLTSVSSIVFGLAMILLPLTIFVLATNLERRFSLGSVTMPAPDGALGHLVGMSFLGDTMVWPFVLLTPALFVLLNVAVNRSEVFFTRIGAVLSVTWLKDDQTAYESLIERTKDILREQGAWKLGRIAALVLGLTFFTWNTLTCTWPEHFPVYTGSEVKIRTDDGTHIAVLEHAALIPKWDTSLADAPISWLCSRVWVLTLGYFWLPLILFKLFNLIYAIYVFTQFLSQHDALDIRPLAPDGAGGLSSLSSVSLSFVYLMVVFAVLMTMPLVKENTEASLHNIVLMFPFVPLFLIVFFVPLAGTHSAMKRAKERFLEEFARLFNVVNERFIAEVRSPTLDIKEFNRLEVSMRGLRDCYEQIEKMAVWPFAISTLHRLSIAILVPLGVPILQYVISRVLSSP